MQERADGTRGVYSRLGRVGVLVPPGNTTIEPELVAMLPAGISLHASRLPGRVEEDTSIGLRERFLVYNSSLAEAADSFGGTVLDAISFGCTGASYLVGPDGEDELLKKLAAGGVPNVNTAARAVRAALEALGAHRIAVVSPYPQWLTDAAVGYWNAGGFDVAAVLRLSSIVSIYAIEDREVVAATHSLDLTGIEAVILSGTGMPTLGAIDVLSREIDIPILSSASCTAWWFVQSVAPEALGISPVVQQLVRWTS